MKKRLGGILLSFALALVLAPMLGGEAKAAAGTKATKVRIAGVAGELTPGYSVPPRYYFSSDASMLEITDSVTGTMPKFTDTYSSKEYAAIWADGDLVIQMDGNGSYSIGGTPGDDATAVYGIYVDGNLTIRCGPGFVPTVTVQAPGADNTTATWSNSTGIYCTGNLMIEQAGNLTLNAYGGDAITRSIGVHAGGSMTVSSGTLTAKGGRTTGNFTDSKFTYGSYGIRAETLTVSAGSVTATGGVNESTMFGYSCGILAFGDVNLTTTGSVTATGGTAFYSRGIRIDGNGTSGSKLISSCRSLTVEGGSGNNRGGSTSIGIETYYKPVNIGFGEVPCEVTFTAGTATVKGGAAESGSYGIQMGQGTLTVSGSASVVVSSAAGDVCTDSRGIVTSKEGSVEIDTTGMVTAIAGGGDQVKFSYGIESGTVKIKGGTVTATGGRCGSTNQSAGSAGICIPYPDGSAETDNTYYQTGGTVTATGGAAKESTGVRVLNGTFSLEGGTLIATGGTATGESGKSYGLYVRSQYIGLTRGQKLEAFGQTRAIEVYNDSKVINHNGGAEDWPWLSAPVILAGESNTSVTLRPYGGQYVGGEHYSEANDHIYNCKYVLAGPNGTGGKSTSEVPKRDIQYAVPTMQKTSFVYDGKEKSQPTPTKLILGGVNIINSLTISGTTKATDAKTYTIYLTAPGNSSFYTGTAQAKWTIAKAANPIRGSSVTVTKGGNTYDLSKVIGNAQGTVTYWITSENKLGCSVDKDTGAFTSGGTTGTVTVHAYAYGTTNYEIGTADVTVKITDYRVSAYVDNRTLTWSAALPGSGTVTAVAAWYDAGGRLLGCKTDSFTAVDPVSGKTIDVASGAAKYKLFLLDGSNCPLCAAWDSSKG